MSIEGGSKLVLTDRGGPETMALGIILSPIGGVRIAAPVVLAQHKRYKRIDEALTPICCASPIVIELAR